MKILLLVFWLIYIPISFAYIPTSRYMSTGLYGRLFNFRKYLRLENNVKLFSKVIGNAILPPAMYAISSYSRSLSTHFIVSLFNFSLFDEYVTVSHYMQPPNVKSCWKCHHILFGYLAILFSLRSILSRTLGRWDNDTCLHLNLSICPPQSYLAEQVKHINTRSLAQLGDKSTTNFK